MKINKGDQVYYLRYLDISDFIRDFNRDFHKHSGDIKHFVNLSLRVVRKGVFCDISSYSGEKLIRINKRHCVFLKDNYDYIFPRTESGYKRAVKKLRYLLEEKRITLKQDSVRYDMMAEQIDKLRVEIDRLY